MKRLPKPKPFKTPAAFRRWLEQHRDATELLVQVFKTSARDKGMTNAEAVDEALCAGWIDGVRRRLDDDSFSVRFSPRRSGSKWSDINIRRFRQLKAEGRVLAAGVEAFKRHRENPRRYSYESRPKKLDAAYMRELRADPKASKFFDAQPPGYRRLMAFWVMSAKQKPTRDRRFEKLFNCSRRGTRVPL